MADYWVSQTRKYCDFCKCWITDNRPSVEFHEKGKRHQENVEKRLKLIGKQSRRTEQQNVREDVAFKQMEAAAMQAYRKDLEAGAADLTASAAISKQLEEAAGGKLWREAKSEKGDTYYWNTDTNESIWEPPGEGYLSIEEQQELTTAATKLQWKTACKQEQTQDRIRAVEDERDKEEKRAAAAREKLKARRVEDIKPVESGPIIPPGKTDAYGGWKTIRTTVPTIDYQLPKQEDEYFTVPIADEKPPPKEFKTKTVESLGGGNTSFRKRKLALTTKRNVRQREDDD